MISQANDETSTYIGLDLEAELLQKENEKLRKEILEISLPLSKTRVSGTHSCQTIPFPAGQSQLLSLSSTKSLSSGLESTTSGNLLQFLPSTSGPKNASRSNEGRQTSNAVSNSTTPTDNEEDLLAKRLIGEVAFQLDRRILQIVFSHRRRLYGFTVRNISEKIVEYTTNVSNGAVDKENRDMLVSKHEATMDLLRHTAGYNPKYHPIFSEMVVNTYGVLDTASKKRAKEEMKINEDFLRSLILKTLKPEYTYDAIILLSALQALSQFDGKPLLIW